MKKSKAKFTRKIRKQGELLSESGIVLCIAPPSLSRDRRIQMKQSKSTKLSVYFVQIQCMAIHFLFDG